MIDQALSQRHAAILTGMTSNNTPSGPNTNDRPLSIAHESPRNADCGLAPSPSFTNAIHAVSSNHEKVIIVSRWFAACLKMFSKYWISNEPEDASELCKRSDDQWAECQTSCPELRDITAMQLRGDLSLEISLVREYFGDLDDDFDFNGIRVSGAEAYVLSLLIHPTVDTDGRLFTLLMRSQPVYIDHPSNVEEQACLQSDIHEFKASNHLRWSMWKDIPTMRELLLRWQSDRKIAIAIVNIFGELASNLCDSFLENYGQYVPEDLQDLEDYILSRYAQDVANPLSDKPLELRLTLADVNIRGVINLLVRDIDDTRSYIGQEEDYKKYCLRWYVLRWVLHCAQATLERVAAGRWAICDVLYSSIRWNRVLNLDDMNGEYNPFPSAREYYTDSSEDESGSRGASPTDLEELSSVELKSSGAEINIQEFASPTVAERGANCCICLGGYLTGTNLLLQLDCCSHVFHQRCLQELVNGSEEHSNACPVCRITICPRRKRQRISK